MKDKLLGPGLGLYPGDSAGPTHLLTHPDIKEVSTISVTQDNGCWKRPGDPQGREQTLCRQSSSLLSVSPYLSVTNPRAAGSLSDLRGQHCLCGSVPTSPLPRTPLLIQVYTHMCTRSLQVPGLRCSDAPVLPSSHMRPDLLYVFMNCVLPGLFSPESWGSLVVSKKQKFKFPRGC